MLIFRTNWTQISHSILTHVIKKFVLMLFFEGKFTLLIQGSRILALCRGHGVWVGGCIEQIDTGLERDERIWEDSELGWRQGWNGFMGLCAEGEMDSTGE